MGYWQDLTNTISGDRGYNFHELPIAMDSRTRAGNDFVNLFKTMGEVQFPIRYIAERVSSARFVVKRFLDDSEVWDNKFMNEILNKPNPLMSFQELVYQHILYIYATGKSYLYADTPENFKSRGIPRFESTSNFYILPSNEVVVKFKNEVKNIYSSNSALSDLIERMSIASVRDWLIDPENILHSRDVSLSGDVSQILGTSRLESQRDAIDNLKAVYEARNVIYTKRGALGMAYSKKHDDAGSVPLTKREKESILETFYKSFGLRKSKTPIGVSDVELGYINFGVSIKDLEPFKETLNNAIQIAGVFGIPADLIPREDHSTFSNQQSAEVAVYQGVVIPCANMRVNELSEFLGLPKKGMYLHADFSHLPILQPNRKEEAESSFRINENCKVQFRSGIISLNDWRSALGFENIKKPIYEKTLLEMSASELVIIESILKD